MAEDVGSLIVRIKADLSEFSANIKKVQEELKKVSSDFQKAGEKISKTGKDLTKFVTTPLIGIGVAATKMAMEAVESENLFSESMGRMADSAREWSEGLRDQLGLNAYEVRKNVGTFNVMFDSMGIGEQKAYDMAKGLTQLSYDMASFYNLKPEEAFQKLQAGITGEAESLKRLGILVDENTIKTYAYQNGITKQGEELTQQQKILARYGAIMEQTSKAQGDLARTMDSPTNQLRIMQEQAKNLAIEIGNKLIPVFQKIMSRVSDAIKWFSNLSDEQKDLAIKIAAVAAAIGPLMLGIGKIISGIGSAIKVIGVLKAVLLTAFGNPVILAIAAVAAAIGAIVILVGQYQKKINSIKDEIIKGFEEERDESIKAVEEQHKYRIDSLNNQLDEESTIHDERLGRIQDEYDEEVKSIDKKEKAWRKSLDEREDALETAHDDEIQRIRDEYGVFEEKQKSKTDLIRDEADERKAALDDVEDRYNKQMDLIDEVMKLAEDAATQEEKSFDKTYSAILDKAREIHDEKIMMYEEEYLKSIGLINSDLAEKVKGYKEEIKKLEDKTDEENRIEREKRNHDTILRLQEKVANAKDDEELTEANKDLADEINSQNLEREQENRRIQIESLNEQINEAMKAAEQEKQNALTKLTEKVNEEKPILEQQANNEIEQIVRVGVEKKKIEDEKLSDVKNRVENEKIEIDNKANAEIAKVQEERIAKEEAENEKYAAAKKTLDDEEIALDNFKENYQKKLDEQLILKQQLENDKFKATEDRLNKELEAEQKAIEESTKLAQEQFDKNIKDAEEKAKGSYLESLPEDEVKRRINSMFGFGVNLPGFADGIRNFKGGAAIVGERGPEIVNLPRGSDVVPNNKLQYPTINNYFSIDNLSVRDDGDIKLIAKELYNLQEIRNRGNGVVATT
jgi:hypothetical protein